MRHVTKKHIIEFNPIFGEKFFKSYYEFSGKIEYNNPSRIDNIPYLISNYEYADKDNFIRNMNYISFNFISDDPTEKIIKEICFYSTHEYEINKYFSKIKNHSHVKLFLIPREEKDDEIYIKNKSKYIIYPYTTKHTGNFIFKTNIINNIFYYVQVNIFFIVGVLFNIWVILMLLGPFYFEEIGFFTLYLLPSPLIYLIYLIVMEFKIK